MGDRGDEVAPGGLGGVAGILLGGEPAGHRIRRAGQLRELVAGARGDRRPALPVADGDKPVPDGLDVAQDAAGHQRRRPHGDDAGYRDDDGHHQRVVGREEHQQGDHRRREQHLADRHADREIELPGQAPDPAAHRRRPVGRRERHRAGARQQGEHLEPALHAVDRGHDPGPGQRRRGENQRRAGEGGRLHGWNR